MDLNFDLASYTFELPENQIAQVPVTKRGDSRLLVLDRHHGSITDALFSDLPDMLEQPCLFVANNAKVIPARIVGKRASGGKAEFLLLTPLPLIETIVEEEGWQSTLVDGLIKPAKNCMVGDIITLGDDFILTIWDKGEFGKIRGELRWRGELVEHFIRWGNLPLPPYIKRTPTNIDAERYQTVYARQDKIGSVAAPTAGLHFTPELRNRLASAGHTWAEVTLYVGYGTFSPVRTADIRDHAMHNEYVEISEKAASAIRQAKTDGRPVIAIGTTAARSLEGAFAAAGSIKEFTGWTDIFLYPGKKVHVVDHLITNFHLPQSSLLMLVAAFAGREAILRTYQEAITKKYKFFSYGDAMLIL